jgi:hypothetical protein
MEEDVHGNPIKQRKACLYSASSIRSASSARWCVVNPSANLYLSSTGDTALGPELWDERKRERERGGGSSVREKGERRRKRAGIICCSGASPESI